MSGTRTFSCSIMHPSLPKGRAGGTIDIGTDAVTVRWDEGELLLPVDGLTVRHGGSSDTLIFLAHPFYTEWTVYTREAHIIGALGALSDDRLEPQLAVIKRARTKKFKVGLAVLACIVFAVWGALALRSPVVGYIAERIPKSWERTLGDAVFFGVKAQTELIDDAEITKEFNELVSPLLNAMGDTGFSFEFHISKDQQLNAFALPGGIIVVNAGTILKSERPEEVLGVLAHELSHVTRRHTSRQVITVFGLYLVVDLALGNVFGTVAAVTQGAGYLLQQGFSREHEEEADITGVKYLSKAGIDPMGMVEFFARLKREHQNVPVVGTLEDSLGFLSTHPSTDDRIEYLTKTIQRSTVPHRPLSKEAFERFQEKLRAQM